MDTLNNFSRKTRQCLLPMMAVACFGLESALGVPSLEPRAYHTGVWTDSEMIIWGGAGDGGYSDDGRRYDSASRSWATVKLTGAPAARRSHTAVWTGSEMIVWGGFNGTGYLDDGARYNPATDAWKVISSLNAPAQRYNHTAVWAGPQMIIWGGYNGSYLNTGGRFNPVVNTWAAVSTVNAPAARRYHSAVWTGSEMIVWGGYNGSYLNDGRRYDPAANTWATIATNNAPSARRYHTAVWTGSQMIIWGGGGSGGVYLNEGARYNSPANTWSTMASLGAPSARSFHTAVWTGSELIVWGGLGAGGYVGGGARYNPVANTWTALPNDGAPSPRYLHTAVWTGSEMIVWGGYDGNGYLNDGARYNLAANRWASLPSSAVCTTGFPDEFECRKAISGESVSVVATNIGATKEAGEPDHGGNAGGHSMWWSWTAPFSGGVTLTTAGSDFDTLLGVYTGTEVSALTTVASDGRARLPASVTFSATVGVNYKIAVDGNDGETGNIRLSLNLRVPPANDNFANRTSVDKGGFVAGQNLGATAESAEPDHAGLVGGKSVWWTWAPTSNSCVMVTTDESDFDTLLAVYTNATLANLVTVAANDDAPGRVTSSVSFNATAGVAYQIAVDGYNRAGGNIVLQVLPFAAPLNDDFADFIVLNGANLTVTASNHCASKEAGEPNLNNNAGGKSLWWLWQAPFSGGVTLDIRDSDFLAAFGVYTGNSLASLTPVASGIDREVFKVVGGAKYRITVDGSLTSGGTTTSGNIVMKLALAPSPANDDFTNRATLGAGIADGSNLGATTEAGEMIFTGPDLAAPAGKTVWWTWTPLFTGPVSLFTRSSNFVSVVTVYTGSSISNLIRVTARAGHTPTNEVPFMVQSGTTYQIAVDGNYDSEGYFTISAVLNGQPPNDSFANRVTISGANTFTFGRNTGAHKEVGEPDHAGIPGTNSVWWSWTAPSSGRLFLTTIGSSFSPMLAIYQGANVLSLNVVASNYNFGCPYFGFANCDVNTALGSSNFQFAVDGQPGDAGGISLALAFVPRPANDNFSLRTPLSGSFLVVTGSVIAATQEAGEVVAGISNGLRTVWYSWTAPTNIGGTSGGVTLRVTGIDIVWTNKTPFAAVYQGNSVSTLTSVPVADEVKGNMRQVTFEAQAGATYQILVAGQQSTGNGVDTSFPKRLGGTPPDPLSESGSFLLRLNYSTPALRVENVFPAAPAFQDLGKKVPLGAAAQVFNYGAGPTGPVRLRVLAIGTRGEILGDEGSFTSTLAGGLAPGGNVFIPFHGACLASRAVLAILEEQVGDDWFFRDSSVAFVGIGVINFTCLIVTGGGVVLLEPGLGFGGQCFCPPILTAVQINGPANVTEGSTAAYWGTAFFNNGSTPSFTNTIWTTTDTNRFPITTNGILSAGSVTVTTPISVTSYFTYVGVERSTNKQVTIQNLPPPSLTNLVKLPNGSYQLSLQGVPNRQHVVEATTNLSPPISWIGLATNAASSSGAFQFTDSQGTNFTRRFYRAREN